MPKFNKPDSPNIIWGINALEGDLTKPSDDYIQTGWTQVKPPYEYENYSMNKLYQGFAYYNQLGIPEWDSVTEYQAGKSYVQGSDNRVYKCSQTHSNENPAASGNEAYWEVFEGNRQATLSARGTTRFATDAQARDSVSTDVALTPSNILNGILSDAVFDSQGEISIPVNLSGTRRNLIVKWGRSATLASGTVNVVYPNPFPNQTFNVQLTDTSPIPTYLSAYNQSKTGFTVDSSLGDVDNFAWLAIGY